MGDASGIFTSIVPVSENLMALVKRMPMCKIGGWHNHVMAEGKLSGGSLQGGVEGGVEGPLDCPAESLGTNSIFQTLEDVVKEVGSLQDEVKHLDSPTLEQIQMDKIGQLVSQEVSTCTVRGSYPGKISRRR